MSSRRFLLLSSSAALLAVIMFIGSVWLVFRRDSKPQIKLPEPLLSNGAMGFPVEPNPPGAPYAPVKLTADRARDVLGALNQPEAYSQSIQTTLYWDGGYQVKTHQWYASYTLRRVETKEEGSPVQVHLFTESAVFRWTSGNLWYYESPPSELRPEDLIGTPSLDTLLALPDERIKSVEYLDSYRLRLRTEELYYNGEYIVSLKDGILLSASYTEPSEDSEKTIYRSITLVFRPSAPPEDLFLLPDGTMPEVA